MSKRSFDHKQIKKARNFVVISYQRTGSTFFVSTLNKIDGIVCHSELFNNGLESFRNSVFDDTILPELNFINKMLGVNRVEKLFKYKKKYPGRFLKHIYNYRDGCTGFKLFPNQNDLILQRILKDHSVKKMILIRENLIRSFVSKNIALKTGKWGKYKGEDVSLEKISLDTDRFLKYAQSIQKRFKNIESTLRDSNQPYLKFTYEQISNRFPIEQICTFLQVSEPDVVPEINQVRQNPFSLSEMVENYEEVVRKLENTDYKKYLSDSD